MNFNPSEEEINFVNDALRRFNDDKVGPDNHVLLNIVEYAAESEAKKRGCHSVHVDTMSWQAPEFYKKHGYKIIGELNDVPVGNKKFHLIKEL